MTLFLLPALAILAAFAHAAPALSRADFNRLADQAGVPLYWTSSASEKALEPGDLAPVGDPAALGRYVSGGKFTPEFDKAYADLVEARRREVLRKELDQGRPTLLTTDFRKAGAADRELVRRIAAAGKIIDELYERQKGGWPWRDALKDPESRAVYARNHSPWCDAPQTDRDPFCNAVASFPPRRSGAYPADLSQDGKLCDELKARPDAKALLDPFTVVLDQGGRLTAAKLVDVYGSEMAKVAVELRAAAAAQGAQEAALKAYLLGAAKGFETGDWAQADEAWSRMGSRNTKWYLRVAPDETGFEACQEKAGFHVSFARIDESSLAWQDKLTPLRQDLEDRLAALIGPAYEARKVAFGLPDFIEIVLNSGDSRNALGATVGQSLPNWGKVAEENRRRTVVMTNLFEDPDSKRIARQKAAEMFAEEPMRSFPADKEPGVVGVILHEAAHNLGPHTDSRLGGKTMSELFGGRLGGTLEELKAQTAALWYVGLLKRKGLVDEARAREIYMHELAWCFGHISNGFVTDTGAPKPYSQLAAVQIGRLVEAQALRWAQSPDGAERLAVDFEKLPAAVEALMRDVGKGYASGDAAAVKTLIDRYVSEDGAGFVRAREVQARLRKYAKESFRYTVRY